MDLQKATNRGWVPADLRARPAPLIPKNCVFVAGCFRGDIRKDPAWLESQSYRALGPREWFNDRIVATPPESMGYPTQDELKQAGAQIALVQIYSATRPTLHSECGHLPLKVLSNIVHTVRQTTGLKAEVF